MSDSHDDAHFIFTEVVRLAKLTDGERRELLQADPFEFFHHLRRSDGGIVPIGKAGTEALRRIAKRYLDQVPDFRERVNLGTFLEALRIEFAKHFFGSEVRQDTSGLDDILKAARIKTESEFRPRRYFIPTAMFVAERPRRFTVGPVEFVKTDIFFAEHATDLQPLERPDSGGKESHLRQYYEDFDWVAVVAIPPACPKVSQAKAEFLAIAALNVIRLVCGRSVTYRTRTADERGRDSRWSKVWEEGDKGFRHSFSLGESGHAVGDDWDIVFTREKETFEAAVGAVGAFAGFSEPPPLCRRFVDALGWYGEAVTDKLPAPRIVKLVTALEVMVGTGPELDKKGRRIRGVTKIVCSRAANWHAFAIGGKYAASYQRLQDIYALRSGLVHGTLSPNDESLTGKSHDAEELVRMVLLSGLSFFAMLGLSDPQFSADRLGEIFRKWEKECERQRRK